MYIPRHFAAKDSKSIELRFGKVPFGTYIEFIDNEIKVAHIPLLIDLDKQLASGHLALNNPLAQSWLKHSAPAKGLFVVQGAAAYISPSWYQTEEVPTYNYIAYHINGTRTLSSAEQTDLDLKELVNYFESQQPNGRLYTSYSAETLAQSKGVLGFQFEIESIEGIEKLSQNRKEDQAVIIEQLENRCPYSQAIAQEMKKLNS